MAALFRSFRQIRTFRPAINALSLAGVRQRCVPVVVCVQKHNFHVLTKPVTLAPPLARQYSDKPPLTIKVVQERVLLVLKLYDKVDPNKLSLDSHFAKDLGLDSLDQVEVIMAMEDEFGFEIPDVDAERLMKPTDVVQYICDKEDIFD